MKLEPSVSIDKRDGAEDYPGTAGPAAGLSAGVAAGGQWQGCPTLVRIFAHFLEIIIRGLNLAPEKNKLAFFDLLGLELIPAQAARVPIVFEAALQIKEVQKAAQATLQRLQASLPEGVELTLPTEFILPQILQGRVSAGTRVAAPTAGKTEPLFFETERPLGLTTAEIQDVISVLPGSDQYINHSEAFREGWPLTLFTGSPTQWLNEVPHEIYLGHNRLFALAGKSTVKLHFTLRQETHQELKIHWEYWGNEGWQGFNTVTDGTHGLKNSGSIELNVDGSKPAACLAILPGGSSEANAEPTFWIRGRLTEPLLPGTALPEVTTIKIDKVNINQGLEIKSYNKISKINNDTIGLSATIETDPDKYLSFPINSKIQLLKNEKTLDIIELPNNKTTTLHREFQNLIPLSSYELRFNVFGSQISYFFEYENGFLIWPRFIITPPRLPLEKAFADGTSLDVSKPFYPMGLDPKPGATFYFSHEESFNKPGAKLQFYILRCSSPQDQIELASTDKIDHEISLEYWNGSAWRPIPDCAIDFDVTRIVEAIVPEDIARTTVNGQDGWWMRLQLRSGGFGYLQKIDVNTTVITNVIATPPLLADFRIGYTWEKKDSVPEEIVTRNDFHYEVIRRERSWANLAALGFIEAPSRIGSIRSNISGVDRKFIRIDANRPSTIWSSKIKISGTDIKFKPKADNLVLPTFWPSGNGANSSDLLPFAPFAPTSDQTPTLYLGFDTPLTADLLGLFWDIQEKTAGTSGPDLLWEYWNGAWQELVVDDDTRHLSVPGILTFIGPADSQPLSRFDQERYWLRARYREKAPPENTVVNRMLLNAVWAVQASMVTDTQLGSSNGTANQIVRFFQTPVLSDERIEVCELAGGRAAVEWKLLAKRIDPAAVQSLEGMLGRDNPDCVKGDLRLQLGLNKKVKQVWVKWQGQPHFIFSGPEDRHYVMDRSRGMIFFGDGVRGKIPPVGAAILAKHYRTGGGEAGNVPVGAVSQNPDAASRGPEDV